MPNTTSSITSRVAYDQAVATANAWADAYYNSGTLLADDDEDYFATGESWDVS